LEEVRGGLMTLKHEETIEELMDRQANMTHDEILKEIEIKKKAMVNAQRRATEAKTTLAAAEKQNFKRTLR
jgi:hypothetical protein